MTLDPYTGAPRPGAPCPADPRPAATAPRHRLTGLVLALALALGCATAAPEADLPRVRFETSLGTIDVEIDLAAAPVTAGNFLRYVDEGRFADAHFYRVVTPDNQPNNDIRIEVVQGGLGFDPHPSSLPAIAHETTEATGLRHLDGTLSMARNEPGSASSEFFFCLGDQPELDFAGRRNPDGQGFAAFGQVVSGLAVLRTIQQRPARQQMLDEKVAIRRIRRLP
ncbi:MAG: peptidylprolyl isomerase [Acidobacteriota bacterium]